jgi:hypothetical protein
MAQRGLNGNCFRRKAAMRCQQGGPAMRIGPVDETIEVVDCRVERGPSGVARQAAATTRATEWPL